MACFLKVPKAFRTHVLLAEFEKFVRIVLFPGTFTILAGFMLFNSHRANFGACDKFTTGLTLDLRKVFCKSLLLREYKI